MTENERYAFQDFIRALPDARDLPIRRHASLCDSFWMECFHSALVGRETHPQPDLRTGILLARMFLKGRETATGKDIVKKRVVATPITFDYDTNPYT